ncbi:MAG: DNA damage-inducible protein D [Schwartzia sp.]|nr:DNA damage-inducible protein D [Schwartzia sp. (in: firmicutes)]
MPDIERINETLFESIRHINEYGQEYWTARELQAALGYKQWRQFSDTVRKAKESCESSDNKVSDHFADVRKMVEVGSGARRGIEDFHLSRYACYLVAMNGDPRKKAIALAQTYFAVKTRQQELIENYDELAENEKRLAIRREVASHNKQLADAAHEAGVLTNQDFGIFQNYGYRGLYGGLDAKQIHKRKGLRNSQHILDHMGSTELAANLFRATQTEEKIRRENIRGKENANRTHFQVGKKVRQTITDLGGTMPEDLPTPKKSIKQLEREQNAVLPKGRKRPGT